MKQLKKDLQSLAKNLKSLAQKTEKIQKQMEKMEKARMEAAKKAKPKAAPKAKPVKRTTAGRAVAKKPAAKKVVAKKPAPKRAAAKKPARAEAAKKAERMTAVDAVFQAIQNSAEGADTATLREKTGFNNQKIRDNIYKLRKRGKIKTVGRGVYVSA